MGSNRPSVGNAGRSMMSGLHPLASFFTGCCLLAKAMTAGNVFADEPAPAEAATIKVEDVALDRGIDRDTATLRFKVNEPSGSRFYVSYLNRGIRGAAGFSHVWEIAGDKGTVVELSFGYRPEFQGDRSVSPLESSEEMLNFKVDVQNCVGSPCLSTIVSAPLYRAPRDERQLISPNSAAADFAVGENRARRLLLVTTKSADAKPKDGKELATFEPRTELLVQFANESTVAKPDPWTQLQMRWLRQGDEIGSAHIKYRAFRTGDHSLAPLSQARVNEILAAADLDRHPENFADAVRKVMSVETRERPVADKPWAQGEFFTLGLRTRDELADFFIRVYDGEWDFAYSVRNNQINVHRADESHMARTTVRDFRLTPPQFSRTKPEIKQLAGGDVEVSSGADNRSTVSVANPATGFIRRSSYLIKSEALEQASKFESARDYFQFGAKTYPGRIVFPSLIVKTGYVNDRLTSLEMIMIESAEFNDSMQKKDLELAAPAKTHVFLFDKDPVKEPKFIALPKDVDDVAEFLKGRNFLSDAQKGE